MLCLLLSAGGAAAHAQRYQDFSTKTPLDEGHVLVIGFLGGRESWDNQKQSVRKMALKLRGAGFGEAHVETVENNRRSLAIELIRNAFDRDGDGQLDERERASARLILYGQSFGGAAVVKLARRLEKMKVPILLTVQVDSIGRGDKVIPSNVARAANLFQRNGLIIKGEREIYARDPGRTTIIGNFEFDYSHKKINISEVSWRKRLFRVAHTKMDHDPAVWGLVEKIILDALPEKRAVGAGARQAYQEPRVLKGCSSMIRKMSSTPPRLKRRGGITCRPLASIL
ncbi:MAG TPA: hypothetical protein VKC34_05940 [Blastocatellia bacterium]|nr:hypothetical protein [Blastocatellia bacterium]